jgi:flagellar protein FliO/FliZ
MYIVLSTSGVENVLRLLVTVIAFILILLLTYFATRFMANYQKSSTIGTNFELIETYRLSNMKYLQLIRVGKRYVVIAVCKDTVVSITELGEEEVLMPDYAKRQEPFKKIFENLKKEYQRDHKEKDIDKNDSSEDNSNEVQE